METTLDVAKSFSPTPAGRYTSDGPYSGEAFREKVLIPTLKKHDRIIVLLDSAEGYGSSFLEEAFGGLVRVSGLSKEELKRKIELRSDDDSLIEEIWSYVDKAK